jgi:hypothetical protein
LMKTVFFSKNRLSLRLSIVRVLPARVLGNSATIFVREVTGVNHP